MVEADKLLKTGGSHASGFNCAQQEIDADYSPLQFYKSA